MDESESSSNIPCDDGPVVVMKGVSGKYVPSLMRSPELFVPVVVLVKLLV